MDILMFFFDNWKHFIQLCFVILLVCPWHCTATKKHIIKFDVPKPEKREKEKEEFKAHG